MKKREIQPLSEAMASAIAKSINKIQHVSEAKSTRPADSNVGDTKTQDISGEEPVKTDGSATKAPARKGDNSNAMPMEKIKESKDNDEDDKDGDMDPVNKKALKKGFKDREDKDIDNDGDEDESDEYLHKRRQAITKAFSKKDESVNFNQPIIEKVSDDDWVHIARAGSFNNPKKDTIIGYSKSLKNPNVSPKLKAGANSAMRVSVAKEKGYAIKEEVEHIEEAPKSPEYQAGAKAAREGKKYADNPHTDSQKRLEWSKGHNAARASKLGVREEAEIEEAKKYTKPTKAEIEADRKKDQGKSDRMYGAMRGGLKKEEAELDEAKNYEIKDGKIYISKANFRKVHKDYKNATKGQERMMALDPKTGGSASFKVVFTEELDEAKDNYTIYHKTFSSAVQHAAEVAKKRGYEVDDDDWDRKVAMGPRKPGQGKTNSYSIELTKGGKPTKQKLQMQVYYDEGRYELNMYIS